MYMEEGRMRDDSTSSPMSLFAKFQVWGGGVSHAILEGRSLISYICKLVGSLCCSFGVWCMNEESQPHRDSGSKLASLGCTCSLPHKNALGLVPALVSLSGGSRVGNCRSAAVQLPFL